MSDTEKPAAQLRKNGLTYADAGVSIDAGNALVERIKPAVAATRRVGVLDGSAGGIGGFAGLFDLKAAGYEDPLLVAATDGVGTKLRVAIDAGDVSTVGIDLVAMCVNDLLCQGAEPLFFLDYLATGALDPEHHATIVEGVAAGCREAGCALLGGETAEMPGMYAAGDFDLAGFAVGAVSRAELLPRPTRPGDVLLGLPSTGPHSNGYSLIRRIVADRGLGWDAPAPFAPEFSLGAAMLTPTRIYAEAVLTTLRGAQISALAHVTGGGLTENVPRVLSPEAAAEIDLDALSPPAVFPWLAEMGGVDATEMLRTFNCGVGMVVAAPRDAADAAADALAGAGVAPIRLGRLVERAAGDPGVVYRGALFS